MYTKCSVILVIIVSLIITSETKPNLSYAQDIYLKKPRKIFYFKQRYCTVVFKDRRKNILNDPDLPMIYFATPTYPRPEQMAELTRLSHTLMLVPRLYWIVADDNLECSKPVADFLTRTGLPYAHISSPQPDRKKNRPFPPGIVPRGVANRRAALTWINKFAKTGILYFGDDDNAYDLELFDEIRKTKKLSMVPVGLTGKYSISTPLVKDNKVIGFFDSWYAKRKFPIDMAGFAVNLKYVKPIAVMPYDAGRIEDRFLTSLGFEIKDIEPLAANCTKILVWHTQTKRNPKRKFQGNIYSIANSNFSNLAPLLQELSSMNVMQVNSKSGANAKIQLNDKSEWNLGEL